MASGNIPVINNNMFSYHVQFLVLAVINTTHYIWEETFLSPNIKGTFYLSSAYADGRGLLSALHHSLPCKFYLL